jgi:hypothetical protein
MRQQAVDEVCAYRQVAGKVWVCLNIEAGNAACSLFGLANGGHSGMHLGGVFTVVAAMGLYEGKCTCEAALDGLCKAFAHIKAGWAIGDRFGKGKVMNV